MTDEQHHDSALPAVGKQIVLRDWDREDIPRYREYLRPGQEWQDLDGPYYPRPSKEETERSLERLTERIGRGDWPRPRKVIAIADAETNQLIGQVSRYWQSKETCWLSAGVVVFEPRKWRRGIGYEALGLWSDYLFELMPELARLDLRTWSGNHGMMRLAEKLGYRLEARFRNARLVDGEYYDGLGYGVLREEWRARFRSGFARSL